MRILIFGSGFVGSNLAGYVRAVGDVAEVVHAPRLEAAIGTSPDMLAREVLQHRELDGLVTAMNGADCVVVAAGLATPDAQSTPSLVGANALLPGVLLRAAQLAGVRRFIHLSSAAVQGRRRTLTERMDTFPFSPYSASKATGEDVVRRVADQSTNAVLLRATSVQGAGRPTTTSLRRIARSHVSSVAGAGDQPSPVSSIGRLCAFVHVVARHPEPVPLVVLQPWEGMSAGEVLRAAGGREPIHLPNAVCTIAVRGGYLASRLLRHRLDGPTRRVEAMWFGQSVEANWAESIGVAEQFGRGTALRELLASS